MYFVSLSKVNIFAEIEIYIFCEYLLNFRDRLPSCQVVTSANIDYFHQTERKLLLRGNLIVAFCLMTIRTDMNSL